MRITSIVVMRISAQAIHPCISITMLLLMASDVLDAHNVNSRYAHLSNRAICTTSNIITITSTLTDLSSSRAHNPITLTHPELIAFHNVIKDEWAHFVRDAPHSWKTDKWIQSRSPVGIVAAYGQNLPIHSGNPSAVDRNYWSASRDYHQVRFLTIALATHLE
jgi:hypothetical protein